MNTRFFIFHLSHTDISMKTGFAHMARKQVRGGGGVGKVYELEPGTYIAAGGAFASPLPKHPRSSGYK